MFSDPDIGDTGMTMAYALLKVIMHPCIMDNNYMIEYHSNQGSCGAKVRALALS